MIWSNVFVALTLIMGSAVCGAMCRFYWARRVGGMPPKAMIAFFLMALYILARTVDNYGEPEWLYTILAFAAFAMVLIGVRPYLTWKKK